MSLLDDFMSRAVLAGLGVAMVAGPLGCFVLWRRMVYFGDATAHAAILGVALALALGLPVGIGVLAAALGMAVLVGVGSGRGLAGDVLLGVGAHAGLAFGLVAVALVPGGQVDLEAFLFGDILAVARADVAAIWAGALAALGICVWRWRRFLTATLSGDLALAEGIDPVRERFWLLLLLAGVVAIAIKVVGALLITALLIVPAAAARGLSRTPEAMALLASFIGMAAVAGGLWSSAAADLPAGPAIVVAAVALLGLASAVAAARR